MKKRMLAAILALAMALALLPGTALAVNVVAEYIMDFSMIGPITWGTSGITHDFSAENIEGTGWKWYATATTVSGVTYAAKTLVLNDFHFTTSNSVALKLPAGATIDVLRDSTFTSGQAASGDSIGILVGNRAARGVLTITGSGTLTGKGGNAPGANANSYGVLAYGNIAVSSGALAGISSNANYNSFGVFADEYGSITISGTCALTGKGGSTGNSFGVLANGGDITVSGGTLTGEGGSASGACNLADGVYAGGSITVSGGTINGTGGSAVNCSRGVRSGSGNGINVSGGTINAASGSVTGTNADSYGVYAFNVNISGGTVTAKSAKKAFYVDVPGGTFGFSGDYTTAANRRVTAGATAATASEWTGTDASELNGRVKTNPYAYVRITPATLPISITPNATFPVGISGGNRKVVVGHGTGLAKGNIGELSVGGDTLREGTDYTKANSASVDITLKESWLNSLPAGTHRLNIPVTSGVYAPQTAYIDIVVTGTGGGTDGDAAVDVPKTGDPATPFLWAALLLLAGAGLCISGVHRRKKRCSD